MMLLLQREKDHGRRGNHRRLENYNNKDDDDLSRLALSCRIFGRIAARHKALYAHTNPSFDEFDKHANATTTTTATQQ